MPASGTLRTAFAADATAIAQLGGLGPGGPDPYIRSCE